MLRDDPWQLYAGLDRTPTLLLHGALSDILTNEIVAEMSDMNPDLEVAVVADTGHAPLLDEPEAVDAIVRFLDRVS